MPRKNNPVDPRPVEFQDIQGCCEASSFEYHYLWREYVRYKKYIQESEWVQSGTCAMREIGTHGGLPIWVLAHKVHIQGKVIAFYQATSLGVNYDLVREWVNQTLMPPAWKYLLPHEGTPHGDADNFGNLLRTLGVEFQLGQDETTRLADVTARLDRLRKFLSSHNYFDKEVIENIETGK